MPIETQCTGCQNTLRVADEHAGKRARCPICDTIYTVPTRSRASQDATERPTGGQLTRDELSGGPLTSGQWEMRREGRVYGPASKAELDRWVSEGRVDANALLRELPHGVWVPAGKLYPVLLTSTLGNPFTDVEGEDTASSNVRYVAPHRGGTILVLGILSWILLCPLFGIIAWALAATDLNEMKAGRMDPSGQSLTRAGMVLSIVHLALFLCLTLPFFLLMERFR